MGSDTEIGIRIAIMPYPDPKRYSHLLWETAIRVRFLDELPDVVKLSKKKETKEIEKSFPAVYDMVLKGWRIEGFSSINRSLKSILDWMNENKMIPERFKEFQVKNLETLRNLSAHLSMKSVFAPTYTLHSIWNVIDFVNCLYDKDAHDNEPHVFGYKKGFQENLKKAIKEIDKRRKGK